MSLFPENFHKVRVEYMIFRLEKIVNLLRKYCTPTAVLGDIKREDLYKSLALNEEGQLWMRAALEEQEGDEEYGEGHPVGVYSMKDFPVSVDFDGSFVTVKTPLTLNRKNKKDKTVPADYALSESVSIAFDKWYEDHPDIDLKRSELFHGGSRLLMHITRKVMKRNKYHCCDNDNFESRHIQNAICSALFLSDSCFVLDLMIDIEVVDNVEDCGTEFCIGRTDELIKKLYEKTK